MDSRLDCLYDSHRPNCAAIWQMHCVLPTCRFHLRSMPRRPPLSLSTMQSGRPSAVSRQDMDLLLAPRSLGTSTTRCPEAWKDDPAHDGSGLACLTPSRSPPCRNA